ncbi:unnamed protein product [Schistosoma margrebowiei]|uniref:Uncharacterized protein n=1 Tax=Schistosoma margrebowiei TaxID=48269 RepID=A0A183M2Q9_9TREM|nr:unnamed protein product [Schistosoma margrebowiei]
MTEQTFKVLKLKTLIPQSFQLIAFCLDNIVVWYCYVDIEVYEHGVSDSRAQLLTVVKALPRTPSYALELYGTVKGSILQSGDSTG